MEKLKIIRYTLISVTMMVLHVYVHAQTWTIKLISTGKYEVDITPPVVMGGVTIYITYLDSHGNIIGKDAKSYTTDNVQYLRPGNTYSKNFTCKNSVARVKGNSIDYYEEGGGDKADGTVAKINEESIEGIKGGHKVPLEADRPVENVPIRRWYGWQRAGGGSTDAALSVCEANDIIYLFAKGLNKGDIYINTATRQNSTSWRGWVLIPGMKTNVALSSAIFSGNIYVFAKDENNHNYYNYSAINVSGTLAWQGWQEIGGTTDASLNASVLGDYLYLFAKGINDAAVYFNRLDNTRVWSGWNLIPGGFATNMAVASHIGPPALNQQQRLWIFGVSKSNEIFYNILSNNGSTTFWTGWNHLPSGGTTDRPLAITGNASKLILFSKGISDRKIYTNTLTKGQTYHWSGWSKLEGEGTTDVNVAVTGNVEQQLILFSRGINDNRIYMNKHR